MTNRLPPLGLETRKGTFQPKTANLDARTVELVWSTGAKVLRSSWSEQFYEELDMKGARLDRLKNGAPFLADHDGSSVLKQYGVVESARVENGKGIATVRFDTAENDPDADKLFRKVVNGIVQNISVGYRTHKFEKVTTEGEKIPTFRVTDWTPHEISAVTMGADDAAGFRSSTDNRSFNVKNKKKLQQEDRGEGGGGASLPVETEATRAAAAERERIVGIQHACRTAKFEPDFAEHLVEKGVSMDRARTLILEELVRRDEELPTSSMIRTNLSLGGYDGASGQRGGHADFVAAAADGLVLNAGIRIEKPHAAARDMRSSSIFDIARTSISRAGKSTRGLSNSQVMDLAIRGSTGDFPMVLSGALRVALRNGYETEPSSHKAWVRPHSFQDFRMLERPVLGSMPGLTAVAENGEYTNGNVSEDGTSYRITKFGRMISLSWEVLKNDQLGVWLRMQPAMGQAARRAEADAVYVLFAEDSGNGPLMQDAVRLFHLATHANVTAAADLDVAGLGAARALLRKQTAVGGGFLNLEPKVLLVGADLETKAEVLMSQSGRTIGPATEGNVPKWIGGLQICVEPRLAGTSYYVIGDANQCDHIELGLLDENMDGPVFDEEAEFRRDNFSYKVRHCFGVKALDWRNIVRVPYTPPS